MCENGEVYAVVKRVPDSEEMTREWGVHQRLGGSCKLPCLGGVTGLADGAPAALVFELAPLGDIDAFTLR